MDGRAGSAMRGMGTMAEGEVQGMQGKGRQGMAPDGTPGWDELAELEERARRSYGPARLGPTARGLMWLLRLYVAAMVAVVVLGFLRQMR